MRSKAASAIGVALVLGLVGCSGELDLSNSGGPGGENGTGDPNCWSSPGSSLFSSALCLCDQLKDVGALFVTPGPSQAAAPFGVNGAVSLATYTVVDGSFTPFGGLNALVNVEVRDHAITPQQINVAGALSVGKDLSVGGNLTGIGAVSVGGVLRVGGSTTVIGKKDVNSTGPYSPPAGPPCACDPGKVFDVRQAVDKAHAANDNALKGLPTSLTEIGGSEITLSSGKYYFDRVTIIGELRLTIDGTVALYLDGSLDAIGVEKIKLTPGSTLDLYISGSLRSIGYIVLGDRQAPASFRLYVAGAEPLAINIGDQEFFGTIYAPASTVTYVGRTIINGGLFGRTLQSAGLLRINYDRPPKTPPGKQLCPPPAGSTPKTPGGELPDPDAIYSDY